MPISILNDIYELMIVSPLFLINLYIRYGKNELVIVLNYRCLMNDTSYRYFYEFLIDDIIFYKLSE